MSILVGISDVLIHHHWTWNCSRVKNIWIRVRILTWKEPGL